VVFEVRQYEQGAQQLRTASRVHAQSLEDPPAVEAGEAECSLGAQVAAISQFACFWPSGELVVLAALVASDDDRVLVVLVDADEAEVGQGAEVGSPQVLLDLDAPMDVKSVAG
jgi:hypothetical protein